jgi:hypothetical protein
VRPTYTNNRIKRWEKDIMADNKKFIDGIRVYKPHEKAPEFVKGNLVIDKMALIRFLDDQPNQVKAVIKVAKSGNYYLEIDTYQPQNAQPSRPVSNEEDLPF